MAMESIHITISRTQRGTPWEKTCIQEYDIEAEHDEAYKAVAQEIIKLDPSPYDNGLYVRAVNESGETEAYLLVPTEEDGKKSFFVRNAYGNDGWYGYDNGKEEMRYLVCLDEETNDYKSYTMFREQDNDRFGVSYGRIGGTDLLDRSKYNFDKEGSHFYPAKMFWIKYYEKIMKGYIDKTEEMDYEYGYADNKPKNFPKPKELSDYSPIKEEKTKELIEFLISRQREYVSQNYNYYSNGKHLDTQINEKGIERSEYLLGEMNKTIQNKTDNSSFDDMHCRLEEEFYKYYKELLLTLPRKVADIKKYIERVEFDDPESDDYVLKVLEQEKDLLNALKDVIKADKERTLPSSEAEETKDDSKKTILEEYGLSAQTADFKDKFLALDKMGEDAYRVSKVLEVRNDRTARAYEKCKKELGIEERGCHLLWHGSRTENWWSIFKNGMSLNPNAVITGKMFGQGLYFAPLAKKSMGYADIYGSYWAHGTQNTGYMALFEVAMGKPYEIKDGWLNGDFRYKDLKYGCHSVWAKAGSSLRNDECIVYREDQCNMKYLVEVDNDRDRDFSFDIKKARNLHLEKITYTQVDKDTHYIDCAVPNFKTCTGISAKGVTLSYNIDTDEISFPNNAVGGMLNEADYDYIKDVFKSKFADNEREFAVLCEQTIDKGKIPDDILKAIRKENRKVKENSYV